MALRPGGGARPAAAGRLGAGGGLSPLRLVLLAATGTLLVLAILVWSVWRDSDRLVVLDMPAGATPRRPAAGTEAEVEEAPARAAEDRADLGAEPGAEPGPEGEVEAAVDVGDPAFFETPMRVVRRSNIRAEPTPDSTALGRADEGTMVILVDPEPTRGYYRIATGELEGWIWGANLAVADPSQQPDAGEGAEEASPADEPAEAAARP
ncbi:MAG: SH3 domain-containing protein [Rhodospirillales bacterium]